MSFQPSSRSKLTSRDLPRFAGTTLFDRIARAVCSVEALPRKELYESWEIARRTRRRFRGGRVVDLACGHALVAHLMLVLDATSESAIAADVRIPESAARVAAAIVSEWPRLEGRVQLVQSGISQVVLEPTDVVVSAHACGALTDAVLDAAIRARARVAVLPCCHAARSCDTGGLEGWLDPALAIDVTRAAHLRAHGYDVHTQHVPSTITPKNRLLFGAPR